MGLFEHFPYVNFHDLNLDVILKRVKDAEASAAESAETVEGYNTRLTAAEGAVVTAQNRADSAYNLANTANGAAGIAQTRADNAYLLADYARNKAIAADGKAEINKTWIDNNGALHIRKTLTQPTDTDEFHSITLGTFISSSDIDDVIALIKTGQVIFDIKIIRNLTQSDGQLENYISVRPEYHTITPGYLDGPCISAFAYIPYSSDYWETINLYYYPDLEDGAIEFGHA